MWKEMEASFPRRFSASAMASSTVAKGSKPMLAGDVEIGGAGEEHAGEVSGGGASGVPHEEGVGAVVAVAIAVLVDELGAVGEVVGEEVPELVGVQGHGKEPLVELPVGGVVYVVELVLAGVGEDDDAARSDQGLVLEHAVGVLKTLVGDQERD